MDAADGEFEHRTKRRRTSSAAEPAGPDTALHLDDSSSEDECELDPLGEDGDDGVESVELLSAFEEEDDDLESQDVRSSNSRTAVLHHMFLHQHQVQHCSACWILTPSVCAVPASTDSQRHCVAFFAGRCVIWV